MRIGPHLKKIRLSKEYTLNDVATRLHISASLLSQIENDKTSPSLQSLEELLKFYAVNFSDFFKQVEQNKYIIVRKAETETLRNAEEGLTLTLLASKLQNNALESFIGELEPGSTVEIGVLGEEINGERVVVITEGALNATIDRGDTHTLETGDSLNFKSYVPCALHNNGRNTARFFISGIPPVFL